MSKTALVVSAHPGDFVWRAGGAIALHAKRGYRVKIVCLAFGERGESQFAWKQPGMTLDKVMIEASKRLKIPYLHIVRVIEKYKEFKRRENPYPIHPYLIEFAKIPLI